MASMVPAHEFVDFLTKIRLDSFVRHFHALRVEIIEDLQDVTEKELEKMGMNPTEIRRYFRKVNEALKSVSWIIIVTERIYKITTRLPTALVPRIGVKHLESQM